MKTKIFAIISFLLIFCFVSCSNVLEEKEEFASETVAVSFNFGNSRAIVSSATPSEYTYTLKGTFKGNTSTLCEKLPYDDFISKSFTISHGEWTFEITAYKNDTAVYGGSVTQTLVEGNNTVSFTLRAVTGGSGSLSITLKYPASADVKTILAGLYDSIPSSIPDVASAPAGCTVFSPEASASSVTFESASIPSGVNKFVEFFIYDSQNFCIGSYIESVFLTAGDSIAVERTTSVNSFAATVNITVQGSPWNDSGILLKAKKDNKEYDLQPVAETNQFTASLPLGVYDIYKNDEDTGVDLTVTVGGNSSATVNLESVEYYATVADIATVISKLTVDSKIIISGELSETDINTIRNEIRKSKYFLNIDLRSVTGLETIPNGAFNGCGKIKTIKLPGSITSIEEYAFAWSPNLVDIEIPDSVQTIGRRVFSDCTSLKNVTLPTALTSIGEEGFKNCRSLEQIVIPANVQTISWEMFNGCTNLKIAEIPDTVTTIESGAFENCSSLTNIILPHSLNRVDSRVFSGCTELTNITIPENVKNINDEAFFNCESLTEITIPSSVEKINSRAFANCKKLESINIADTNSTYSSENGIVFNKAKTKLLTYPSGKKDKSYSIPSNVNTIGTYAFSTNQNIESISILDNVTVIEKSAFSGCSNLTNITLSSNITSISEAMFDGCLSLSNVVIPNKVTTIDRYAFHHCDSISSLSIPDSVISINEGAFENCQGLENFEIPSTVTSIGTHILRSCINLQSVVVKAALTQIPNGMFEGCSKLVNVELPVSVKTIGDSSFRGCSSLENLSIPSSVTNIGERAFYYCKKLDGIQIPDSVKSIAAYAFSGCSSLQSISIPTSLELLGFGIFFECSNLKSIVFEDTTTWYYGRDYYSWPNKSGGTLIDVTSSTGNNISYFVPNRSKYLYKL